MVKVRRLWPALDSKAPQKKGQKSRRRRQEKVVSVTTMFFINKLAQVVVVFSILLSEIRWLPLTHANTCKHYTFSLEHLESIHMF